MRTHTLRNAAGMEVRVADRGGIILSLTAPDRAGRLADVVLGFDDLAAYVESNESRFGAIIGRYANRIAGGRFTLGGTEHVLARNEPPHHLHGGARGFDRVRWRLEPVSDDRGDALVLRYTSPDGEEGYPGTLAVRARYTLTDTNRLEVDWHATTDRPTPVNLTQHSYFNLGSGTDVLDHRLTIRADRYTPVDETLIPTGELRDVTGTPFDFRAPRPVGSRIDDHDEQLRRGSGYDHNYVLDASGAGDLRHAATVRAPSTGRTLDVYTTEPGLQLYTGNHLAGTPGKGGTYGTHAGLALETQHFPDSPNRPAFPSTILRPGQELRSRTVYAFGTDGDERGPT